MKSLKIVIISSFIFFGFAQDQLPYFKVEKGKNVINPFESPLYAFEEKYANYILLKAKNYDIAKENEARYEEKIKNRDMYIYKLEAVTNAVNMQLQFKNIQIEEYQKTLDVIQKKVVEDRSFMEKNSSWFIPLTACVTFVLGVLAGKGINVVISKF